MWVVEVDPWAVVVRHGRWYLLCRSHRSDARRAYRIDRVRGVQVLDVPAHPPADLDPVAMLEEHLAVGCEYEVEILIDAPLDTVAKCVPRTLGLLDVVDAGTTRLAGSTSNPGWYAEQLAAIPASYRIVRCPELREAARVLGQRLLAAVGDPAGSTGEDIPWQHPNPELRPAMLTRTDLRGRALSAVELRRALPRAEVDVDAVAHRVAPVIDAVRERGVEAALELSERFDGVRPASIRVPAAELARALAELDPAVRAALAESIARARRVHEDQRRTESTTQVVPGGTVTERWVPVARVGLYAPGGLAVYPSTVVMNVVPAQVAQVASLVVCSPPQAAFGGLPHPTVLAAAALLGVDEVWAVGGAQAVALLAYGGTDTDGAPLDPVDLITGPGNVYVTAAKRALRGVIGIDSEAGPTEIAILADAGADPAHVAADLISQAEHDPLAASVLVTDSPKLADAVDGELARLVPATRHTERVRTALTGAQSGCVLVSGVDDGLSVVDAYAAEHLEVQTADAAAVARRVRNAGAVFVGPYAPVSLGDYCAGSNHVLPTGGCARHSSGLSVQTFLRAVQLIEYDQDALRKVADHVVALAEAEDLPAHGDAVTARLDRPAGDRG